MGIRNSANTGLSWRFKLEDDGFKTYNKWKYDEAGNLVQEEVTVRKSSFQLVGGVEKAGDNISMMLGFIGWYRTYYQDFIPNVLDLIQKNTSTVYQLKSIILSKFRNSMNKYMPEVDVKTVNMVYDYKETKLFTISIDYDFILEEEEEFSVVRFIQI